MQFIVKLFPEITIKSRPVRQRFTRILRDNLRTLLKPMAGGIQVDSNFDRITIRVNLATPPVVQQIIDILQRTPGIHHIIQVQEHPLTDIDDIYEKTRRVYEHRIKGKTFAVRCKRHGNHPFKSGDIEREVGGKLFMQGESAGVDLKNPEITVMLEIRQNKLYIVESRYPGLGGFPIGSINAALSLISGGFDSTVASYLSMKRGLLTHYCFFNLGGQAHEVGVKEVAVYLWLKYGASHRVKFISVPFEDVVTEILERVDNAQMGVILKRMMLRAATRLANELEIPALITGESVAQVSSQTLANLAVIDRVTDMLVMRPLIMMDKNDIILTARQIGTEAFANAIPEYCGVISVNPTTNARMHRIEKEEARFDNAVLEQAIASAKRQNIDEIITGIQSENPVELCSTPSDNDIVIDIRHPDEVELKPLTDVIDLIKIPFYALHKKADSLEKNQRYLLYCEKGVMSQLHAQYLHDQGHNNFAVYRPQTGQQISREKKNGTT
ncbi:MAG: tRNA 4-thiouridine(8) synthase ThiI [Pseudomonadales bacterium]|nr:tRNA 4-thiouridine(8) synthase ThiI [Pseudomonadales bacterium]